MGVVVSATKRGKRDTTPSATAGHLEQAENSAGFAVSDLQQALKRAAALEGIMLLALIERAAALQRDIRAMRDTVNSDCSTGNG